MFFFFQAEDGIRDYDVTGVQTCALPIYALRANGLEENTLVIFTSDNGGAGYIGLPEVNDPFRGWKITLFEGGIHVPYFIKWPARISAGQTHSAPVHHFDIFATAAAAGAAPLPKDRKIDGLDLVPFARGEAEGVPHRQLFWRSGASQSALVDGWKLNVSDPPGTEWLFDFAADPNEQNNLAGQRPEKLAELRAALAAHNAEQAEPLWPSQASFAINIDKDLTVADEPGEDRKSTRLNSSHVASSYAVFCFQKKKKQTRQI